MQQSDDLLGRLSAVFAIAVFPLIIYLLGASALLYNINFYNSLFEKTNVDFEKAQLLTKELFAYFRSNDASIPSIIYLTENENSHIRDVKFVINFVFDLFYILILLFAVCLLKLKDRQKIFLYGCIFSIVLPLVLLLFSFGSSFTVFHEIFFPQGNWEFPPTAMLVNIYTFDFFKSFAIQILINGEFISFFVLFLLFAVRLKLYSQPPKSI